MKKFAVALVIISLLSAPKVLADEIHLGSKSQEESHESLEAQTHEHEDDLTENEIEDDALSIHIGTPLTSPTPTPVETSSPTGTPIETATPTETPTGSPVTGISLNSNFLETLSNLLKQLLNSIESLGH